MLNQRFIQTARRRERAIPSVDARKTERHIVKLHCLSPCQPLCYRKCIRNIELRWTSTLSNKVYCCRILMMFSNSERHQPDATYLNTTSKTFPTYLFNVWKARRALLRGRQKARLVETKPARNGSKKVQNTTNSPDSFHTNSYRIF